MKEAQLVIVVLDASTALTKEDELLLSDTADKTRITFTIKAFGAYADPGYRHQRRKKRNSAADR